MSNQHKPPNPTKKKKVQNDKQVIFYDHWPQLHEVKVTDAWMRMIRLCQTKIWQADVTFTLVKGQPTKLLDVDREFRFDLEEPTDFLFY